MIIANRSLYLRQGEEDVEVVVRIFAPEPDGGAWRCRYEIGWPEETRCSAAVGFDSIQAVLIALNMIGSDIYASDHHNSGVLRWGPPETGYGFPVPRTIRDLLIGDDAKFF